MAARGVGGAGCVVVTDSIWNRLVPRDLLSTKRPSETGGLRQTASALLGGGVLWTACSSPCESTRGAARMFLTYNNKLKCRAILDAGQVTSSNPRRPPKLCLPALEGIKRWMGDAKRNGGGSCVPRQAGFAECLLEHQTPPPMEENLRG